jgi:hypothetical protein
MCSHIPDRGEQVVRYHGYYSNVRWKKRADVDPAFRALYTQFVKHIRVDHPDIGKWKIDPHTPALLRKIGGIGDPVAAEDDLDAGRLDLGQIGAKSVRKSL